VTAKSIDKLWLSGNEALALGAYEAGVKVASGYPGTPSTEIMENLSKYEGVYTEWAPNEKVGLEVALGASFVGVRALATMKHVGMNVAADPLFTSSYTGKELQNINNYQQNIVVRKLFSIMYACPFT